MYGRDPFNLRRTDPAVNVLRRSNSPVAPRGVHSSSAFRPISPADLSAHEQTPHPPVTATMTSYGLSNGGASHLSEGWQSTGGRARHTYDTADSNSLGEKVTNIFSPRQDSLPMYKDKPYHSSRGGRKWWLWAQQRRQLLGFSLLGLAFLSYWFGILSPLSLIWGKSKSGPMSLPWSLGGDNEVVDWNERAERVKDAFKISFAGYQKHGWGYDEYHPIAKHGKYMTPKGLGWIIIDALDTMMLMNLTSELSHARKWVHNDLTYDQDHDVNTFETTIRMLGGLLSAHYLSTDFPGLYAPVEDDFGDDMYIEKATDLADRLLGAYETPSGVPLASINLHTMEGIKSHADGGASSTAEATSLQLEMKYLAKLTGETTYWRKAEKVMQVVDDNQMPDGLLPIYIHPERGSFRGDNIRLGSRGDSYYEYLIKQYLQTSREEPVYEAMWNESLAGMKKHLITYSSPNNFTVLGERPAGLANMLSPKVDHLVCFIPGTLALATTGGVPLKQARQNSNWADKQEEDMALAEELMKTCWGMYKLTPTGLAPEITHFNIYDPPLMYNDFTPLTRPKSPASFEECSDTRCTSKTKIGVEDYQIKPNDVHNLQRPETVESLFYMWRITGDEKYRKWGWEMFQSFVQWSAVEEGFSSTADVLRTPPGFRDNMESFWLAETLKYFYLLFGSDDVLPLTDIVFNTEAHPFPRFQKGKLFETAWQRKPRGGNAAESTPPLERKADADHIQTRTVIAVPSEPAVSPLVADATTLAGPATSTSTASVSQVILV